jgi:hypothetical protein
MKTQTFAMFGTYENPKPTNPDLLHAYQQGNEIAFIEVDATHKLLYVYFKEREDRVSVWIEISSKGYHFRYKENTTPLGTFYASRKRVRGIRKIAAIDQQTPVVTRTEPHHNLGAAFIGFDAVNDGQLNRGAGFHGSVDNTLRPTDGCVRMYNDDVLVLYQMFSKQSADSIPVTIYCYA